MSGRDVVVRGRVRVPIQLACARCLQPTKFEVNNELSLLLMPGRPSTPDPPRRSASRGAARAVCSSSDPSGAPTQATAAKSDKSSPAKASSAKSAKRSSSGGAAKGRWGREGDKDIYEFALEEADIDTYDGDEVVLDDFIREMILLEAPIFPLCSEECPGIRAIPEVSSNRGNRVPKAVDPRLRPLLDMQTKK